MATIKVNNWYEFLEAVGTAGATVECPENAVWDFNEIAPEGITENITVNADTINGNGTDLRNMLLKSSGFVARGQKEINGIRMTNAYVKDANLFYFDSRLASLKSCIFSGLFQNANFLENDSIHTEYNSGNPPLTVSRCSLNVQFAEYSLLTHSYYVSNNYPASITKFENCNIRLSGLSTHPCNESGIYRDNAICFDNCFVGGTNPFKIMCISEALYNRFFETSTSIFDLLFNSEQQLTNRRGGNALNCLINSDKLNDATILDSFKQVTTEQLHDAAYLASIGFPIGVD